MKKSLLLIFVLSLFQFVNAQEKPLTRDEYVKMLYALQKNPAGKSDIVEALRRRGIGFPVNDGIRGLTRSKAANDEELKRSLEEAERRRQNPEATKPPNDKEASELLEKARQNTLAFVADMPDFVVKQLIGRSEAYAGTGNWKPLDNLVIAVSYSTEKGEQYKVLAKNGVLVNSQTGNNYGGLDGATTSGEFVDNLRDIFRLESKTQFNVLTTDVLRNRRTLVYDYEIALENNKYGAIGLKGPNPQSVPTGEKGKIWIDRDTFRVLRIENESTGIPPSFPIKSAKRHIDYDTVEISGEQYLLPTLSDFRFVIQGGNVKIEKRNLIKFKNYQKYGSDVIVLDDDTEPAPEEKP